MKQRFFLKTFSLLLALIWAPTLSGASAAPGTFATGLPDYGAEEEWKALGMLPISDAFFDALPATRPFLALSAGHSRGSRTGASAAASALSLEITSLPKSISLPKMPAPKSQEFLPSCAAFAIVAAVEQMMGKRFSATEFYLRAIGHLDVNPESGSRVSDYVAILHQGLVEAEFFPSDDTVHRFLAAHPGIYTTNPATLTHRDFVKSLLAWCFETDEEAPSEVRPIWVEVEEIVPVLGLRKRLKPERFWAPFAKAELPKEYDHESYWDKLNGPSGVSRGWFNVFNITPEKTTRSNEYVFRGQLDRLKRFLTKMPIVLSVYIVDKSYWSAANSDTDVLDIPPKSPLYLPSDPIALRGVQGYPNYWPGDTLETELSHLRTEYIKAGKSTEEIEARIAKFKKDHKTSCHAICVYGYDDDKRVFLIQNSWGTWGNEGKINLTYRYVERFAFDANVIIPSKTERVTTHNRTEATLSSLLFADYAGIEN